MNNPQGMPFAFEPEENPEVKLSHLERMALAEERAKELHNFLNVNDVVKRHQETIGHLLVEEKYSKNLVCMFSTHAPVVDAWAPTIGIHHVSVDQWYLEKDLKNKQPLTDLVEQIGKGYTLSNISYRNGKNKGTRTFMFVPRNIAEYNYMFVQLCVVLVVEDDEGNVLLLRNKDDSQGRVKGNISFVQGHVETSNNINNVSAKEYLGAEVLRELEEEVGGLDFEENNLKFGGLFYDNRTQISMEHISAIFKLNVKSLSNAVTNEPDKHEVLVIKKDELSINMNGLDNIVTEFVKSL